MVIEMVASSSSGNLLWSDVKVPVLLWMGTLILVCIILLVSLGSTMSSYDQTVGQNNDTVASLYSQLASKDALISSLRSQVDALNRTAEIGHFTTWKDAVIAQNRSSYTSWNFSADYAGYVYVYVYISTPTTWVRVLWTSRGVNYDNQITVGDPQGAAAFPVLPSPNIEVRIGNLDVFNSTEHVTVTYVYGI